MGSPSEGEFIVVRLGRDEVPFAPGELALSARGKAAAAAAKPTAGKSTAKATSSRSGAAKAPAKAAATTGAKAATKAPAKAAPAKTGSAKATPVKVPAKPARRRAAAAAAGARTSSRRASAKRSSRRGQQPLTVTVRYSDGKWTAEGHRGPRRLARATAVRPGAGRTVPDVGAEPAIRGAAPESGEAGGAGREE